MRSLRLFARLSRMLARSLQVLCSSTSRTAARLGLCLEWLFYAQFRMAKGAAAKEGGSFSTAASHRDTLGGAYDVRTDRRRAEADASSGSRSPRRGNWACGIYNLSVVEERRALTTRHSTPKLRRRADHHVENSDGDHLINFPKIALVTSYSREHSFTACRGYTIMDVCCATPSLTASA